MNHIKLNIKSQILIRVFLLIFVFSLTNCKKNVSNSDFNQKIALDTIQLVNNIRNKDLCYYKSHIITDTIFDTKLSIKNLFPGDSGVLTGKGSLNAIHIIKPYLIMDTFVQLNKVKIKYFRNKDHSITGCFYNYSSFESVFFTIKKRENYTATIFNTVFHGNYNCCTNEYFNLSKHEDFYTFEYCGTGSGYCEKNLVFFKDITNIDLSKEIVLEIYSKNETGEENLTSEYLISNDTIIVNYKDEIRKNQYKEYNLTFVYKNGNIVLLDSLDDINFARLIRIHKVF